MKAEAGPHTWRMKERLKEKAAPAALRVGRHSRQGDVLPRLVLGDGRTSASPHPPARILWAYREALRGLGHMFHPGGLSSTVLIKAGSPWGKGESGTMRHFQRDRIPQLSSQSRVIIFLFYYELLLSASHGA